MCSKTINGFKVLPLQFSTESHNSHELFIKEHSVRNIEDSKPAGRTLFVLNVPPYATADSLKTAFNGRNTITSVLLQDTIHPNNAFKVAYIVFNKRDNLLKALNLNKLNPLSSDSNPLKTGLPKWIEDYNRISDPAKLTHEVNSFLARFDKEEKKNSKKDDVDDEGWTVVSKKSRTPGLARKESVANKLNEKIEKGAKRKELLNFYTFQKRENKMKNIADLRKNYEEAKKKVSLMKNARRFKPY